LKKKPEKLQYKAEICLPFAQQIRQAAHILAQGGIVAFPTETCYGLAVDPWNETALQRLFQIKNRPAHKPVLLLIHDRILLDSLVSTIPEKYKSLMDTYWPGPLTLIFPAQKGLSRYLTGGTETVGIRISPNPLAMALCRFFNSAITATSANLSGQPSARRASEIVDVFGKNVDYVLDEGGETLAGRCSTIIGIENGNLRLLRSGVVEVPGVRQKNLSIHI